MASLMQAAELKAQITAVVESLTLKKKKPPDYI